MADLIGRFEDDKKFISAESADKVLEIGTGKKDSGTSFNTVSPTLWP
jgi:hypothetical protein